MLTVVDIVLLVLLAIIVLRAGLRGFVEEATGVAWIVLGFLFSFSFFKQGAAFIRTKALHDVQYIPEVLAFLALFFIAFVAIKIIGSMLKEIIERTHLDILDKALGFIFGFFKAAVLIAALIFLIRIQPVFDSETLLKDSVIARLFIQNEAVIQKTLEPRNV